MGSNTPRLGLYKPGGGSTGLNGSDEVVDIDRINQNFDLIDSYASATDTKANPTAASDAARNALIPTPVAGDAVFRTDKGYTERYYTAYHATSNPGGATPAGWYPEPGADVWVSMVKNDGFQTVSTSTPVLVTGMVLKGASGGSFTVSSNRIKVPVSGMYRIVVSGYATGTGTAVIIFGINTSGTTINMTVYPSVRVKRTDSSVDETAEGSAIAKVLSTDTIGLLISSPQGASVSCYGGPADPNSSTGIRLEYAGPPK